MRIDRNDGQEYADFWDWLGRSWHALLILSLVLAYVYYRLTTEEA